MQTSIDTKKQNGRTVYSVFAFLETSDGHQGNVEFTCTDKDDAKTLLEMLEHNVSDMALTIE